MKVISNTYIHKPNIFQKYYTFYFELIIFLIKISLFNLVNKKYMNYCYSEIHLVIKGQGEQNLIQNYFSFKPSEVIVNGIKKDSCEKKCKLVGEQSHVTLRFENQFNSCYNMFGGLNNIIEIDLSDFDASQVTTMQYMLNKCSNIEKINFGKK